jgi:hypothetical protein
LSITYGWTLGTGVGAERAAALAVAHGRVDPAVVEELLDQPAELGRERLVGVEHELAALAPADARVVVAERRHAVVVAQLVDAEQLGLQAVPAAASS